MVESEILNNDGIQYRTTCKPGDEIVISGIAGRFPNSKNINELEYSLFNKIDLVDDSEMRWRHEHAEIPKRTGKIHDLQKFDATFFGVHAKQAAMMDPQARLVIEHAYEAILDAGINPKSFRGSRTGVFVGASLSETEYKIYEKVTGGGFGITGCSRAMIANRISYVLDLQGPSYFIDSACSSTMFALDAAYTAIRSGECDAAIVGASNLLLHPFITLQFARLGVLSPQGYCRPFDDDASGYSRSEAASCILIQKAKDAKRIYGTVVYTKTNCDGYKEEGTTCPSAAIQTRLLSEFYKDIQIKPENVDYVEAHGTGTIVGDLEECTTLDAVFCKNRKTPLPVGSVKSNLGHTEPAAGMCSIAKCIIAMETQLIPPNINFVKGRSDIKALEENRLQVVVDSQPLPGPLLAINSFGYGGANAHVLLRANPKGKLNKAVPKDKLPRLINWSGRTEQACQTVHEYLATIPLDVEYAALIHSSQSETVSGNVFRSFGIYSHVEDGKANCITSEVQHFSGIRRPIVYVFSGMGSQWAEMGTSLMEIPIFRETIKKCHNVLLPKGLDLINIITSSDKTTFDNILNSFVGIASIQVAICDVLTSIGIKPDVIIGHSVGELGCAYADSCLTAEQMVLCAYSRGIASIETDKIKGSMAAIGLGYQELINILPSTIDAACHNGPNSCTISGPQDEVEKFVSKLKSDGVFAREVPCSNIAYHSRYISDMGPTLLNYLSQIITDPKPRSEKWLSSSVPKSQWHTQEAQYCSAEYQTNNLLGSVLFEETSTLLPSNAITIEIAPHGLLQAIIRKSMPNAIHVALTQRGNKENLTFFLTALGKIYLAGLDIAIENIYPEVEFPVSRGTPRISHLVRWDHTENWNVLEYEVEQSRSGQKHMDVTLDDQDFEYVAGHVIDGRCLFPATGYLHLVWETFAQMKKNLFTKINVQFEDVKFLRATTILEKSLVEFIIMINMGSGRFEISHESEAIVSGYIKELPDNSTLDKLPPVLQSNCPILSTKDFYTELRLRGYQYSGAFKNVIEARADGLRGKVRWENNWVSFMDCLLQMTIVGKDTRGLLVPTSIQRLTVNTKQHIDFINEHFDSEKPETHYFDVLANKNLQIIQAGGIEIKGLHTNYISRRKPPGLPVLESSTFIPYLPTPRVSRINAARICVQHALENNPTYKVKSIEIIDRPTEPIIPNFKQTIDYFPLTTAETMILSSLDIKSCGVPVEFAEISSQNNCMFIISQNCLSNTQFVNRAINSLNETGYLVSREPDNLAVNEIITPQGFNLIAVIPTQGETLVLLQKQLVKILPENLAIIKIASDDETFAWIKTLQAAIKSGATTIAYAEKEPLSGILGLMNCVRKESGGNQVSCFFIDDETAPAFDPNNTFYKMQLSLGLGINVYRNGKWGTYRHLLLEIVDKFRPIETHAYANITQKGDLSSLKWIQGSLTGFLVKHPELVKVQYSALNFRDVLLATGKLGIESIGLSRLEQECVIGFEFAGVNQKGQRVMGMVKSGAIATHIVSEPSMTWRCPDNWTLEQAVTVPVVYATVYVALFLRGNIQSGQSILIHAGTGGIGLAAIQTAFAHGLTVYTTVSGLEKKKYLLKTFPSLDESNIGNSRDLSFEKMIKLRTNGTGVDYVLNSLAEEQLLASIRCLSKGGKFLQIGKFDLENDIKIGLRHFLKEASFYAVLLDRLFFSTYEERTTIQQLLQDGLDSGNIQPLPATVYPANQVESALRYLASAKHIGKVVLKIRESPTDRFTLPIKVKAKLNCDPSQSYIIPGGLSGFGLELTDWLIVRGARKIILSSSRGISTPYQEYRIRVFEGYGAEIRVSTENIGTSEGCEQLLLEANKLGPVGGIFNLAVLQQDNLFEKQTREKFLNSFGPKATATRFLDQLSRKLCPHLKYFVVFSSVSCGRGIAGQANYGMANSIMERIVEQRQLNGLPAKAIQWGDVGEVGLVADIQEGVDMEISDTLQQRISSCLEELDTLLFEQCPIVSTNIVLAENRAACVGDVMATVMNIMSIRDIKSVSMDATLSEMGMDPLMEIEIKQTLECEFDWVLSPQDLKSLSFAKLYEYADTYKNNAENAKFKLTDNSLTGIHMLFRNLGDESTSRIPMMRLTTQFVRNNYNCAAIVIPGIEGVAGATWNNIGSSLTIPAFCLQLTKTIMSKTIQDIASSVMQDVVTVTRNMKSFYLIGYSFGGLIALELANMLEKSGMHGKLVLIDSSPIFLRKMALGQTTTEITENSIQIMLSCAIVRVMFPLAIAQETFKIMSSLTTWEERVNKLLELGIAQTTYSATYLKTMAERLYSRALAIFYLKSEELPKINSPITLIRPREMSILDIVENYELDKYTHNNVEVKFIEGNHASILENPNLPKLLNDFNPY